MLRSGFFRILVCVLACFLAFGQTKIVVRKGKPSVIGTVEERKDDYVVQTKYGPVLVPKEEVQSIGEYLTVEQEYQRRLAQINSDSPEERFALGKWAFEKDLLEQADRQVRKALELRKDYPRASLLLRHIQAKMSAKEPRRTEVPGVKPGKRAVPSGDLDPAWLLTDKEIAKIRLAELQSNDRARIVFRNNLLSRFMEQMNAQGRLASTDELAEFRRWPRPRQANYILETSTREGKDITDDIVVKTESSFMLDFRRWVWPIVARSCATGDCHGAGRAVGGFRLLNMAARTSGVDYTNFLLLDGHEVRGRRMIDRDYPESSLLLQFGLPRDQALHPHPVKIRAAFRDTSRRGNYLRVLQWLEMLKGPPHPSYGVKLRVPWLRKAPATATQPASKPAKISEAGPRSPT